MTDYSGEINAWMLREFLSFDRAAELLGVSSCIVRLWVSGARSPSLRNQRTLDRVLGISSNLQEKVDGMEVRIKRLEEAK